VRRLQTLYDRGERLDLVMVNHVGGVEKFRWQARLPRRLPPRAGRQRVVDRATGLVARGQLTRLCPDVCSAALGDATASARPGFPASTRTDTSTAPRTSANALDSRS
jgi:hypothetical protein